MAKAKSAKAMTISVQAKFAIMREDMQTGMIERDEEVDVVLTALIAQENPLLVGPPGTGKSMLLDSLVRWLGANEPKFSILFNKFTVPEEVFGPISVKGLKEDTYRRITVGKLPEAVLAFGDEIFKASSAILNTVLRAINEHVFENGDGVFRKIPLRIFLAASNEWPNDDNGGKELGALFDRFLFRKVVRPISTAAGRRRLLWNNKGVKLTTSITVEEIDQAHEEASELEWSPDAVDALEEILDTLSREGIRPGDRRQYKSVKAAQAYAYLCGSDMVLREHLEILSHVLWDDPTEQPEKCAKVVARIANPTGAMITEKLMQVQDILDKHTPTEAVPKLQAIKRELEAMPDHDRKDAAVSALASEIKRQYNKVIGN